MAPDVFVQSYTHLKDRPKADQALPLLQRIASLVKPIMRKHDWILPALGEFFPESDSLVGLNINSGQKILLRLRPPWAPGTFYDEEQLVSVMLHELTHNVHGPHDSKFYAFLAKLEEEYTELKRSGYAGEGFHSPGVRLGAGISHNLPPHIARQRALEAAEKRRKIGAVMRGGGRLGGGISTRNKTPRELAAEAAEKRARDEKTCGSGQGQTAEKEAQRAAKDSIIAVIDVDALPDSPQGSDRRGSSPDIIILDEARDATRLVGPTAGGERHSLKPAISMSEITTGTASAVKGKMFPSGEWTCEVCTLINVPLALQCDACLTQRPKPSEAGWTCLSCGFQGISNEFWSCRECGWVQLK